MPVVVVALGALLLLIGAVLLVPLPEAGLPLVLGGLRLLGRRYAWARRLNVRVDAAAARAHRWWKSLAWPVRLLLGAVLVGVAVAAGVYSVQHLLD